MLVSLIYWLSLVMPIVIFVMMIKSWQNDNKKLKRLTYGLTAIWLGLLIVVIGGLLT